MFMVPALSCLDGIFVLSFRMKKDNPLFPKASEKTLNQINSKSIEMGIDKKLFVKMGHTDCLLEAHGNNLLPGLAGIVIDPFQEGNPAINFFIAHEIAHIKNNDLISIGALPTVASIAFAIMIYVLDIPTLFPSPIAAGLGLTTIAITHYATFFKFFQYRELQADKTALKHCNRQEKEAALAMFKEMKKTAVELRNKNELSLPEKLWRKLTYTEAGDLRSDLTHPCIDLRIQQIEDSLNEKI